MYILHASRRLTHAYSSGWSYLDQWGPTHTLKVTPPRLVREGFALDEGDTTLAWATLGPRLSRKERDEAVAALISTVSGSRCTHEYDCCGCATRSVTILRRKGRRILFRTDYWYNY